MTFKTMLASVSTAALLALPVAAQEQIKSEDNVSGVPAEELNQAADSNYSELTDQGAKAEAEAVKQDNPDGVPAEELAAGDTAPEAMDDYTLGKTDSLDDWIDGATEDTQNAWIGNDVRTSDGVSVGTVDRVYTDGTTQTAVISLDQTLGLDDDEFLIRMGAASSADSEIMLPIGSVEFKHQYSQIAGLDASAVAD
ncbi:PRC-barrel domain-containing protein [Pseudooceanicola aestuarii]|uniref:PRC-barrel domain-containing protein n=1 Tax=Pseudooceanicola aestuarii TaxID=2697319 RepID=UPI0013D2502B|nr:PRC-barrel domain-containing protein [Pseudooceanicola aestuarii]